MGYWYGIFGYTYGIVSSTKITNNTIVSPVYDNGEVYGRLNKQAYTNAFGFSSYTTSDGYGIASKLIYTYPLSGSQVKYLSYFFQSQSATRSTCYRTGFPSLLSSDYEINDDRFIVYENKKISGKYKLKGSITPDLIFCTIPLSFSIDGVYYDSIVFNNMQSWYSSSANRNSDRYLLEDVYGLYVHSDTVYFYHNGTNNSNIKSFAIYNSKTITNNNIGPEMIQIANNRGDVGDYYDTIFDFGSQEQDVPSFFLDWVNGSFEKLYDYNYEIKNSKGQVLASLEYAPEMKKATLSRVGEHNILTLLGINDINYTMEWDSSSRLENAIYLGLNTFNLASYATIPVGETIDVTINKSTTFYDVFTTVDEPFDAFDIVFYKNMAEQNKLDKRDLIQPVLNLRGVFRNESSIVNPTFVIQSDVFDFNYCYISKFNRYYFVDNITSVGYNLWRISLTVDVLMSYREQINMLEAVVKRNEFDFDAHLVDVYVPTTIQPIIEYEEIPSDAFDTTEDNEYYICLGVSW